MLVRFACFLLCCLLSSICLADKATIASASNFKFTLEKLKVIFEDTHPHKITTVTAASGVLFNQARYGAPFDVFLSADSTRPKQLEEEEIAVKNTRFTYALGTLIITAQQNKQTDAIAKPGSTVNKQQFIDFIRYGQSGKIAIANPKTAPYGIAAMQTLQSNFTLVQLEKVQQHLVTGTNINQSYQYIATGNATIGFAALAQTGNSSLAYWLIPPHWYQPIRQQAILLQSGKNNQAAKAFLAFLKTPVAKDVIRRQGYTLDQAG